MLKEFYYLSKPGIVRANLFTAAAAYIYATDGLIIVARLVGSLLGITMTIAAACVFNNILDRNIDSKMTRTNKRALVTHTISAQTALIYGVLLLFGGLSLLFSFANLLTVLLGVIAVFWYVVVYGYVKRKSDLGTLVGTVAGALPPVAGYAAVTGNIGIAGVLLFLILVVWQMPHFYAIAIYRRDDYRAASIPVLSLTKGLERTRQSILAYILMFCIVSPLLWMLGFAAFPYGILMIGTSVWWLVYSLLRYKKLDANTWARAVFGSSLLVLTIWSILLASNIAFG